MSDYAGIGEGLGKLFKVMGVYLVISLPLVIWKLVEIILWLVEHIHLTVK
jgi:hypothetical protein